MIPADTKYQLDNYVKCGVPVGDFLYAVLTNDLFGAFNRADEHNRYSLFDICSYIYCYVPLSCYGTSEKVKAWLEGKCSP